jgi:hypothetical protein
MPIHIANYGLGDHIGQVERLVDIPVATGNGTVICADPRGTGRYLYILITSGTFWRYDTYTGGWQQLATGSSSTGVAMIYDVDNNCIWLTTNTTFWRYTIATNVWTVMSVVGITSDSNIWLVHTATALGGNGDYIYRAEGAKLTMLRYQISDDAAGWVSTTAKPATGYASFGAWDFGNDTTRIIVPLGSSANFYSYPIGSAWNLLAPQPALAVALSLGSSYAYDPDRKRLYFTLNVTNQLYYYDTVANTINPAGYWSNIAGTTSFSNRMVYCKSASGTPYLYWFQPGSFVSFYRMRIGYDV